MLTGWWPIQVPGGTTATVRLTSLSTCAVFAFQTLLELLVFLLIVQSRVQSLLLGSHINTALLRRHVHLQNQQKISMSVHLLTLYFMCATSVSLGFAGQTHLVMGFGNLTARNGLVTEPHKSLLTSACWLRL